MGQHRAHSASEQRRRELHLLLAQALAEQRSLDPHVARSDETVRSSETHSIPNAGLGRIREASADCIKILSFDGLVNFDSEYGRRRMEIDDFDQVKGQPWVEFWSADQRSDLQHAIDAARSGGVGQFVGHRTTAQGTRKWWDVIVSPIRNTSGTPTHLLAISRDVTTARLHSESRDLLNRELGHRMKNLFALVNGLITLTARTDPVVQPFADTLRERFLALSRALDYVLPAPVPNAPRPAGTLQRLLQVLLAPYENLAQHHRRFVIVGDDPLVGSTATISLALSVHELATNAIKHGALSGAEGRVSITCRCNADGECELAWTERGGPVVAAPPERTGFGSKLLLRSITGTLGGQVTKQWDREGLTLRLVLPLTSLTQ
jgi:two-component sensor histidine kinase